MSTKRKQDNLHLHTINRAVLDFDFERVCSVSLVNSNIYCCLVCGKYLNGRGKNSHAYLHSLASSHHVFVNLTSLVIYILPDLYIVDHPSLSDIPLAINPVFTLEEINNLSSTAHYDLNGSKYYTGFVGLNNITHTDYVNVIVHGLSHVTELRDSLLALTASKSELTSRFGLLVRKLWSSHLFQAHVSPHEFLQQVSTDSNKLFTTTNLRDPIEFLSWFLMKLNAGLGGSIVNDCFQGSLSITTRSLTAEQTWHNHSILI